MHAICLKQIARERRLAGYGTSEPLSTSADLAVQQLWLCSCYTGFREESGERKSGSGAKRAVPMRASLVGMRRVGKHRRSHIDVVVQRLDANRRFSQARCHQMYPRFARAFFVSQQSAAELDSRPHRCPLDVS
ncbi:putative GTPase activator [Pseudozyma hubeiensis SY62]|uniref:Putative GTPase activator n=1 Tax=Pseudozyma hubeiensis (strain SY62) TaxID=1305764 RepID=R9NXV5_PSEHS|nr:putative GTPase activator [Pseudozyma hubeiensis SY62]GAC93392.1 putative GTPase activator [Pseudozyma hubeiensis SY62]